MKQNEMIDGKMAYFSWILSIFFFMYQYISRLSPGVIASELMQHFQINAFEFSKLTSTYYLIYALMQIPVGILLDRFGARYVIFGMSLICAIANLVFVSTTNLELAIFCRGAMGFASIAGFIGSAKVISSCFPKEQYNRMITLTFAIGLSGAFLSGQPLTYLMEIYGWKNVLIVNSYVGFAISILIWFFIKGDSKQSKGVSFSFSELWQVLGNKKILLTGIGALLAAASYTAFADVWGNVFLNMSYGINKEKASLIISNLYLGMCFGGLVLSYFGTKFDRYVVAAFSSFAMCVLMLLILFKVSENQILLSIMTFLIGILCGYQVLMFIIVGNLAPKHLYAIATSVTNTMIMGSGSVFQSLIGFLIEKTHDSSAEKIVTSEVISGMERYGSNELLVSLLAVPVGLLIAGGIFLTMREGERG